MVVAMHRRWIVSRADLRAVDGDAMNIMLKLKQPRQLGNRCQARIDGALVWVTITGRAKAISGPWVYDVTDDSGKVHNVTEDKLV